MDCEFTEWGTWSDCSTSCNGIKRRSRRIGRYGRGSGISCIGGLKETRPCNPNPDEAIPLGCVEAPPINCKLSHWAEWSACTATCEGGQRIRSRELIQLPSHGGKICEDPLSEVEECNRVPCPGVSAIDCKFRDWYDWGACGKCSGQRKRFRSIIEYPAHGGKNCKAFVDEEVGSCPQKCHEKRFCTWSDWHAWGSCNARCGKGKRSRRRHLTLSDMPAAPPKPVMSNNSIMAKYVELHQRRQHLQKDHFQQLVLAFSCGCFCFVLAFASVRLFSMIRTHSNIHSLLASAQHSHSGCVPTYHQLYELNESEWPLVTASGCEHE